MTAPRQAVSSIQREEEARNPLHLLLFRVPEMQQPDCDLHGERTPEP